MKNIFKRSLAIVLSCVLVFALLCNFNIQVNAATIDYVYAEGKYIKNWGVREQVATFLSPNADAFYEKNQTSYSKLAALSGSSDISQIPSSALYQELQNLMKKNHTFITDYGYTRYKFQYTDIQNSGKDSSSISSFYSGKAIGPKWDTGKTWNREHVWPNSKGDKAGDGENDIMMLRPTASSENGARGNRAYGKSAGYYNPNMESGEQHDLRGDVARIVLYQYVRWNCINTGSKYNSKDIFGMAGIIESREILLEWNKSDPVDTWELGRNDSVQSITGTRNVFVDYPELAFVLFGEQVPADYTTPSGSAKNGVTPPAQTPENNEQPSQNNTQNNQSTPQNTTPTVTACTHAGAYKVEEDAPRCEIEGYTEGKYCPDCKKYISGRVLIEATGHSYSGDCDAECDVCGSTREISTDVAHKFGDDNVCTVCGIENIDKPDTDQQDTSTDVSDTSNGAWGWIIIAGGILVIAVGVTLIIIYRDKIWPKDVE